MSTERAMLDLLHRRYGKTSMGARRYAVAEHVSDRPSFPTRVADFIAIDCWPSAGFALHGHEVKVSRSDWLTELRDPGKAETFKQHMDYWWLVIPDRAIVKAGELPNDWGLLVLGGGSLRVARHAPKLMPEPAPRSLVASLLRATAKTAAGDAFGTDWIDPLVPSELATTTRIEG